MRGRHRRMYRVREFNLVKKNGCAPPSAMIPTIARLLLRRS